VAQQTGQRIVKLIGYDCGRADMRRSRNLPTADADFDFAYPLQILGWSREDCVAVITEFLGPEFVPIKSACYFCPASKIWELFWLAAHHPDLLERALFLERNALTGKHSRFDEIEFGASWEELVRSADRFPSSNTTVGLGRNFSWNQWARVNGVVDDDFHVRRGEANRARFLASASAHCGHAMPVDGAVGGAAGGPRERGAAGRSARLKVGESAQPVGLTSSRSTDHRHE